MTPWLTLIGIGEDGLVGLGSAARAALDGAEAVFGGPRHLALAGADLRGREWPVPFDVAPVLALRGRDVVVLASGDPFWHGAGGSLAPHLAPGEWTSHPAPSTFQMAANRLGWRLEDTVCMGLHAAPFARLRPVLSGSTQAICLLRDGAAPAALAAWLAENGFADTAMTVLEALGGPGERIRAATAAGFDLTAIAAPVAVALRTAPGTGLPRSPGLPDDAFAHDGQITRAPVRALTLSALAPRPGAHLWDLGAGSGSVAVEFVLAGGRATAVERRADRAANVRLNAERFGIAHRMQVVEGVLPGALEGLAAPDAVFVGGGCDEVLMARLWQTMPPATALVVNAVTLETEGLLATWHGARGGTLWRFAMAEALPLGGMRGWVPARPVVQWRVTR
ncbi:MAG: precorrin-6y C5,15-methyltransferase (decarboxylating) subunit CbiE [Gemmobacter sp.]